MEHCPQMTPEIHKSISRETVVTETVNVHEDILNTLNFPTPQQDSSSSNISPAVSNVTDVRMPTEARILCSVKEISEQEADILQIERQNYEEKLHNLLDANRLAWKEVPADGNCFLKQHFYMYPTSKMKMNYERFCVDI